MEYTVKFLRSTRRRIALLLLAILLTASPLQVVATTAWAVGIGSWVDGEMPQLVVGDKLANPFPPQCYADIYYYHSYTKPSGQFDPVGRQIPVDACSRPVGFGHISNLGNTYIKPGTALSFPVFSAAGFRTSIFPNPDNDSFYFGPSVSGGMNVALFNNLGAAGKFEPYDNVLAYKLDALEQGDFLRDSVGNRIVKRSSTAYSSDGTFMVMYADGLGLLRVNTLTHETLLFDTERYNFGLGFTPSIELAISDDGKTVIRSGFGNFPTATKVFDLSGCQDAPFVNGSPNNSTPGCLGRLANGDLSTSHPGFNGLANMRFTGDGNSVRAVADFRNSSGVSEYFSASYSVAGYNPPDVNFLALGDSFSSGEGELDDSHYEPGTNETEPENKCHLSDRSYPYILAQSLLITDFHSVACSGAKSQDYYEPQKSAISRPVSPLGDWLPGHRPQKAYVKDAIDPKVVTLSLGGNDIGFADKLKECVTSTGTCKYAADPVERANVAKEIANLYEPLKTLYNQIIADTNSNTKIYVIGYPQIMSADLECGTNVHFNGEEVAFARLATEYLNQVVKAAADKTGVYFVDIEDALEGTNLCSTNTPGGLSVNGLTPGDDIHIPWPKNILAGMVTGSSSFGNEGYHPNAYGHTLMAEAIKVVASNDFLNFDTCPNQPAETVICPQPGIALPTPATYFGAQAINYVNWLNNPSLGSIASAETTVPKNQQLISESNTGRTIRVTLETGLKPGSTARLIAMSDPTELGSFVVEQNGSLDVEVTVPSAVPAGYHTLHLFGEHVTGEAVDYYQHILISGDEGDLDQDGVPDDEDPCGFVEASGQDKDRDGLDDACDPEIGEVPTDTTPPEVTGAPDREPNIEGWYNSDVTVNWAATDPEPSSGEPIQPDSTIATLEGTHIYTSGDSCDPAGNCATGSLELKIDKTLPSLGGTVWTNNPKSTLGTAYLYIPASDNLSGLAEAEYYLGEIDPGQGNGATMQVGDDGVSVGFNTDFPTGVYKVTVRVKDKAGNWSPSVSDYLVVYDPFGTRMTGKHTLTPSLSAGDLLPGLIAADQDEKAKFGFNVRYDKDGKIHKNSDFQFDYSTGTKCNSSAQSQNCHTFELDATSIEWLTTQGQNYSTGIFQGTATLRVDDITSNVDFRLVGLDGERLDNDSEDHLTVMVYPDGSNPITTSPLYRIDSDVLRGNIKISKW